MAEATSIGVGSLEGRRRASDDLGGWVVARGKERKGDRRRKKD